MTTIDGSSPPPTEELVEEVIDDSAARHAAPLSIQRIIRSGLVVIFGFLFTKLISLGQAFIIADEFGLGSDYDAYTAANLIPEQIIKFLAIGALSVAFIPVFSGLLNRNDSAGAWRLASMVFNTLFVITFTLSVIFFFAAPWFLGEIVVPGFSDAQIELSANLMRILLASTILLTLSSLLTGILNAHNNFFMPVLAPIFFDIALLLGIIFLIEPYGVYGLAWGTVIGSAAHLLIQIPGLFIFKAKWYPRLGWRNKDLHQVVRLVVPRMLASGVFAINFAAISRFASELDEGALSSFNWGIRIMDIPEALIGTALGFVIFPTLAALSERGDVEERRILFSRAVRFIIIATLPAAAGMIVLGRPAISILFTDPSEVDMLYPVVQVMAFAMVFQAVHEVVARAFYAQKDTVVPLFVSIAGMVVNILVLVSCYTIYNNIDGISVNSTLAVGGTALGYMSAFLTELSLLTIILQKRWQDIDGTRIFKTTQRTFAATLLMGIIVLLADYGLTQTIFTEAGRFPGLLRAGLGGLLGVIIFWLGANWFNIEEVKQLPGLFWQWRRERKNKKLASA